MPRPRLTDNIMCHCGHSRGAHRMGANHRPASCDTCREDEGRSTCRKFNAVRENGKPVCSICQTTTCDPTACAAEEEADG